MLLYPILIIDCYQTAIRRGKKSEETSDIVTDTEESEGSMKRRRRPVKRLYDDINDNSSSE